METKPKHASYMKLFFPRMHPKWYIGFLTHCSSY